MNTDNGALSFDAYINNTDFKRQIDEMNARIKGLSSSTVKETKKMDDAFGGLGKTVMALGSTALLAGFARQLVTVTGEFQKLDIAFTTMLGSKEKSDALMAQIVDTAAKTPFTLQEVAAGAKQLLAYQVAAEKVNETVIRLGNISAGVGVPLGQLVAVYGQVKAKGKLQGDDMKQFMNAGIPIIEELAKVTGKADDQIQQLVTDGKIGFAEVQKVIENLTDKGGMFFNLMEEQSKTLSGQISNLQDAWDRMLNSIGQSNSGLISGLIGGATFAVDNYKEILDVLTPIIAAYGAYKAAIIATAAAHKAAALMDNIRLMAMFRKELGLATAAQQAFNTASKANVVGLALAAVVGLGVAIYNYASDVKTAVDLQTEFNGLLEKTEAFNVNSEMVERYDELSKVQNKTNEEQDEYNSLIDALSKAYPDAIEKIDQHGRIIELNKGKLKEYNEEQKEALKLVAADQLKETEKAIETIQYKLAKAREATSPTKQKYLPGFENQPGQWITVDRPGDERADAAKKVLELTEELQKLKQLQDDLQIQLGIKIKVTTEDENGKDEGKDIKTTVGEQIKQIEKELVNAESKLKTLRLKTSIATPEDIETQEKLIKDLEKELQLLTGLKRAKEEKERTQVEVPNKITPISTANLSAPKLATPTSSDILSSYYSGSLSSDMTKLFGNLDNITVNEMLRIKRHIEDNFQNLKLTPDELEALRNRIDEATSEIEKRNPFAALNEALNDYKKDESNVNLKKVFAGLASSIDLVRGSFDAVIGGIESMGIAMDDSTKEMLQDISSLMEGAAKLSSGIATGNPLAIIQGSISLISSGINLIAGAHDRKMERSISRHKKNVDDLKNAYEGLERAIDKALGGDQYNLQKNQIANLKQQQIEYAAMIEAERDKKKTDSSKINEYKDQIKEAGNAIEDIVISMREDILQTTVSDAANDLGGALIDAFANGENAAEAWGKKVDDIVGNVIRKMLIEKLVEQPVGQILNRYMSQWVDSSGNFLGFDAVMTSAAQMGQELSALGPGLSTALDNLPDDIKKYLFGDSSNGDATLTGQIKGSLTEDTASLLSGYINAIRINQIESLNISRTQLMALDQISANTSHLVQMREVVDQLKLMNRMWSSRSQGF